MTVRAMVLVGSNPLPCYYAAVALVESLQPVDTVLIASEQTEGIARRIEAQLQSDGVDCRVGRLIADATSADAVREVLCQEATEADAVHIDLTGGTKVMSAQGRLLAARDHWTTSYVDDDFPCLLVQVDDRLNGTGERVRIPPVNVHKTAWLHGWELSDSTQRRWQNARMDDPHSLPDAELSSRNSDEREAYYVRRVSDCVVVSAATVRSVTERTTCVTYLGTQCTRPTVDRTFYFSAVIASGSRIVVLGFSDKDESKHVKEDGFELAHQARLVFGDRTRLGLLAPRLDDRHRAAAERSLLPDWSPERASGGVAVLTKQDCAALLGTPRPVRRLGALVR